MNTVLLPQSDGDFSTKHALTLTPNELAKFKAELVSEFCKGKIMPFLLLLFIMLLLTDAKRQV